MLRGRGKSGFTLIELLVVIAIIAILAAILFPVFGAAKDRAYQSACCSNLKQLGAAIQIYSDSWNDKCVGQWYVGGGYAPEGCGADGNSFPDWSTPIMGPSDSRWTAELFPYIKNRGVFACPKSQNRRKYFNGPTNEWRTFGTSVCGSNNSYLLNGVMNHRLFPEIRRASKMVLLWEEAEAASPYSRMYPNLKSPKPTRNPYFDVYMMQPKQHNNGGDYLYVDGHVNFFRDYWTNSMFDDTLPNTKMSQR